MAGTPRALNAGSGVAGVQGSGKVYQDGDLHYLILETRTLMKVFLRTKAELWTDFVDREAGPLGLTVVINGNMFEVANQWTYRMGSAPMAAADTTPQGRIVDSQATVGGGLSRPDHFHVACAVGPTYGYGFGQGDPPTAGKLSAVGGLGPLIIGGLKYGVGNVYKPGKTGPATGNPPGGLGDLVQKNNNTYKSVAGSASEGKVAIGRSSNHDKVIVAVLPHGASVGLTMDGLRDKLFDVGCEDAVFLDGSNSVALKAGGTWHITPASHKNRANTIAVGFAVT